MSVITVTATVEASNSPPRVRLDVADTGAPSITTVNITRLDPNGETVPVRTPDGNPLTLNSNAGLLYDYEMPYGAAVTYSSQETPGNVTTPVTVPETRIWLVHPGVPAVSMPVTVASFGERTRSAKQGVFYPMGRATPVVITDGARKSAESTLELSTRTLQELTDFEELTQDSGILLLNVPAGLGWGVTTSYISVGDITETRLMDYAGEPRRYLTLPFVTVDRPAGGSQSQRTLADLLAFPTLGSLMDNYATFADLLAGP